MIRKDLLFNCIEAIRNYNSYEGQLDELGVKIYEREEVADLVGTYLALLEYCCNEEPEYDSLETSKLSQYIYEDKCFKDDDELWNYLVNKNTGIEDKNEF